ncbi:hypothetical protein CEXT_203051 [Caerostris extrusa]|uniref:Ribosomal protein S4 n=1 Tax=Caerostris extrusa TaxID=172846 RepID=A0AAV4XB95_CAEEX|nr:hypothetical protein CEXT_203051 [Caerostris extrusa]
MQNQIGKRLSTRKISRPRNSKIAISGYNARIKYLQELLRGRKFFRKEPTKNPECKTFNLELKKTRTSCPHGVIKNIR